MAVVLYRDDLDFILEQIKIAEANAAGTPLIDLVPNWELPFGLRTISGVDNNLLPASDQFGAADNVFPRLTDPIFRTAETQPADFFGPGSPAGTTPTSYAQTSGNVFDSQPRTISNLIVDQTAANPAAYATAFDPGPDLILGTPDDVLKNDPHTALASIVTGTRTDGTQIAFTEARLKSVLSSIWTNGGKPGTIMTGAFNKQVFSTFTGRATAIEEAKSKKIVASVDAYESDFGKLKVVANRFQRARDVLVLEMDKWAVAYLNGRNMISIPLAKTGDSDRCQILAEYALVARNEKASGGVFDNTAA